MRTLRPDTTFAGALLLAMPTLDLLMANHGPGPVHAVVGLFGGALVTAGAVLDRGGGK